MAPTADDGPSPLETHVLLALAEAPLYGYAITTAIEKASGGVLSPRAGTLYRVLARLMEEGWIEETDGPDDETHPGRPRRWYALTAAGRGVLAAEARRLREIAELAERRLEPGRT